MDNIECAGVPLDFTVWRPRGKSNGGHDGAEEVWWCGCELNSLINSSITYGKRNRLGSYL